MTSTSTSNLAEVVRHYQRSIERNSHGEDETRLMHCITKLFNLPIKFEHLQETGIGKTVNALRKINGEVGVAAKTLVTKWKAMVAAAEEPALATTTSSSHEEDSSRSNGQRSSEEDQDQENKGGNSSGVEESRHRHKSKHDERHSRSSKPTSSSSSKSHSSHSKSRSESSHKKHKSNNHDKEHKEQKTSREQHHKSKESNDVAAVKPSSSHKSSTENGKHHHHSSHSKSKHEKSKEVKTEKDEKPIKEKSDKHKSSHKSTKRSRSPQPVDASSPKTKIPKIKVEPKEEPASADEFDSSLGANFGDVLGMLNMPISSKKISTKLRSPHKPSQQSTSNNNGASSSTVLKRTHAISNGSKHTSTKKPELLAPTAKLEPLDPSIALELPTISNNYKPMPLNQTVMDVVFNQGQGSSSTHRMPRNFNESEALAAGISSKTMRTKIYSGVRTGQILQVPSLFDLCVRVLQKNIDALEYTGGVPFEVLRPVLERATPYQLLNVEEYNPYLMEDSDGLWQQHVQRHCRSQRREEMETWREMFLRCEEEKERKLSNLAESIKASQKITEAPVRKTQLAFVDSMVKPPRNVQRKQEQYGTNRKLIATPAARVAALSSVTPNAAKVGDARLRVIGATRDHAQVGSVMRSKKAPLMAKTLQFMRRKR
ncbi:transcription elongation factor B polypeptide 3 [Drosophila busckii]|uniref:transcription elongation factor B polypeptide 3 n=1 Tax=Drosophila busckii TaxID=30019 RepID=UPI00083F3A9E|nr:transcription elongation factor B polypeptide 3 [Drosophila busckii]